MLPPLFMKFCWLGVVGGVCCQRGLCCWRGFARVGREGLGTVLFTDMAARECVRSERKYEPHVLLDAEYATLIKKGVGLYLQCSISEFPCKRLLGWKNIDLWVDGTVYLVNPITGICPRFRNLKGLLEFVCHGEDGLLGYTKALGRAWLEEIQCLNCLLFQVRVEAGTAEGLLRHECMDLKKRLEEKDVVISQCHQAHGEQLLEKDRIYAELLSQLEHTHQAQLEVMNDELGSSKGATNFLQRRLSSTMRARSFKSSSAIQRIALDSLVPGSGNAKKRVIQIRSLLNPRIMEEIQAENRATKKRKRVWGDVVSQAANTTALVRILSRHKANSLVGSPKLSNVACRIANDTIKQIGESVTPEHMFVACDASRVSTRGYTEFYKTSKNRIGLVDLKLKGFVLPNPHNVSCSNNNKLQC
jgi:hypothetical protein